MKKKFFLRSTKTSFPLLALLVLLSCSPPPPGEGYYIDAGGAKRRVFAVALTEIGRYEPGAGITFRKDREGEEAFIPLSEIIEFGSGGDRYIVIPAGIVRSPLKTPLNLVSWPAKVLYEGRIPLYSVTLMIQRTEGETAEKSEALVHVARMPDGSFVLVPQDAENFRAWAGLVRPGWEPEGAVPRGYMTSAALGDFFRDWSEELEKKRAAEMPRP